MNGILVRILLFVVVFLSLLLLPWYISCLILVSLTIYLPLYPEVLFFGFLFDILYAVNFQFPYIGLTTSAVFLVIVYFTKTQIRR
ncbi:MAG TPA: hypothetical protein VJG67_00650 [Candidatus Paceibacterota bacterium]